MEMISNGHIHSQTGEHRRWSNHADLQNNSTLFRIKNVGICYLRSMSLAVL